MALGSGLLDGASLRFSVELGDGSRRCLVADHLLTARIPPERIAQASPSLDSLLRQLANHFQMGVAAPWTLQLEDDLARFDLVHEIGKSPVTSGASHLSLENVRHRIPPRDSVRA